MRRAEKGIFEKRLEGNGGVNQANSWVEILWAGDPANAVQRDGKEAAQAGQDEQGAQGR